MHLARHLISDTAPTQIIDTRFDAECQIFTCATPLGFAIYQTRPLRLLRRHELKNGTIDIALPLHSTSLLFLVGGGRSPHYPPNKVIFWDDAKSCEVAELEFNERVRGISCRRGWLAVALRKRAIAYRIEQFELVQHGEWVTCDNPRGLVSLATSPDSTLLVVPGMQLGHVQLVRLPPCPPPPLSITTSPDHKPSLLAAAPGPSSRHTASMIVAHETALTTLTVAPSSRLLATTSSRGTLIRVWDTYSGRLIKELRRGADQAEIYGVAFRPDEHALCVWSDKGTIHVFTLHEKQSNRTSALSPLSPFIKLPRYFQSEWSHCHYRLPNPNPHVITTSTKVSDPDAGDEEKCIVGWIAAPDREPDPNRPDASGTEYEMVALTYTGGWYRLSLPNLNSEAGSQTSKSSASRSSTSAGKSKASEDGSPVRTCTLEEFRRYGRWDGWG